MTSSPSQRLTIGTQKSKPIQLAPWKTENLSLPREVLTKTR